MSSASRVAPGCDRAQRRSRARSPQVAHAAESGIWPAGRCSAARLRCGRARRGRRVGLVSAVGERLGLRVSARRRPSRDLGRPKDPGRPVHPDLASRSEVAAAHPQPSTKCTRSWHQLRHRLMNSKSKPTSGWNGCVTRTRERSRRSSPSRAFDDSIQRAPRGSQQPHPAHQPPQLRLPLRPAPHRPRLPLLLADRHQPAPMNFTPNSTGAPCLAEAT